MIQSAPSIENPFQIMHEIEDSSDVLQYKKGQLIYCEGSTPLGAYFVRHGKVKIGMIGSDGKEQITRIATPGEMLSYTELVGNKRYSNSAKSLEDSTLLFLPKQQFWSKLKEQQELLDKFVMLLSTDLEQAENKMADLAYKPVRGRLADALLYLSRKFNECGDDSPCISITRSDMAGYVGTAKETVNRLLSEFRNESMVRTDGSMIYILDPMGLEAISKLYY